MRDVKLDLPAGKYVIAVSGGVDSMALLDLLAKSQKPKARSRFVAAHFHPGIRPDAYKDEELVRKAAKKYQLPFEAGRGNLGLGASEETARRARYQFLKQVQDKYRAKAIITAHHQDDLLETAVINILRGTGRRGLTAIAENPDILRPLLRVPKKDLVAYARKQGLEWREDPTNKDETYLRNYIRRQIVAKLTQRQRAELLKYIDKVAKISKLQNELIATISHKLVTDGSINRSAYINLPPEVADELVIYWLREVGYRSYNKKKINRLSMAIKTARPSTHHKVSDKLELVIEKQSARFSLKR
jgi:tRNA(Ile)-lysidine synthetase-like protein